MRILLDKLGIHKTDFEMSIWNCENLGNQIDIDGVISYIRHRGRHMQHIPKTACAFSIAAVVSSSLDLAASRSSYTVLHLEKK
jgi:hypothetical protein